MSNNKAQNEFETIVNTIIDGLKKGKVAWQKPWDVMAIKNFATGKAYTGGFNLFVLSLYSQGQTLFAGFGQAKEKGLSVIKGSKGIPIFFPIIKKDKEKEKDQFIGFGMRKVFSINSFEGEQLEAIKKANVPKHSEFDSIEKAEKIIANSGISIVYGGNSAHYKPTVKDKVFMPEKNMFHGQSEYYRTLFHEIGHNLSYHAEGEDLTGQGGFGSESYSKEELTAEIFSNFLASYCGIDIWKDFDNSQAYLNGWVSKLSDQPVMIRQAANKAEKRLRYLLKKVDEIE